MTSAKHIKITRIISEKILFVDSIKNITYMPIQYQNNT